MVNFFAARDDVRTIVEFLYAQPSLRLFESSSRFDCELREFKSFDELCQAFRIGDDAHGNGSNPMLQIYSREVLSNVEIRRIELKPGAVTGAQFRYALDGAGLMTLHLGGLHKESILTHSSFAYLTEAYAKKSNNQRSVNWTALKKAVGKIQYFIKKAASAAAGPCAVLPNALKLHDQGVLLKFCAQTEWNYEVTRRNGS